VRFNDPSSSAIFAHEKLENNFMLTINKLATYSYPCTEKPIQLEPLVLIHGWGSDSDTWNLLLIELRKNFNILAIDLPGFGKSDFFKQDISKPKIFPSVDNYIDAILDVIPDNSCLMGWSLGGALATSLLGRQPSRFSSLITIATNPCFIKNIDWNFGMPNKTFNKFYSLFKQDPSVCLKNFYALQRCGDIEEKKLSKLSKISEIEKISYFSNLAQTKERHFSWLSGLKLLAEIDNRDALRSLEMPSLHIFGKNDQLVDVRVANETKALNPLQQIKIYKQKSHVLHRSITKQISSSVVTFLQENRYFLNKKKIAYSFSNAAKSYNSASRLQRHTGARLLKMLPDQLTPGTIVDLGCGTGFFMKSLHEKYVASKIIGLDLAEGMLKIVKSEIKYYDVLLCGDAEKIPLADNSVDIIFANLSFQWCGQLALLAREISRIIKPGGRLAFTSLGRDTLCELKTSWMEVDSYVHVNKFLDSEEWKIAFIQEGFNFHNYEVEDYKLTYRDLSHLMEELKDLGAHNLNAGQKKAITSRSDILTLINAYSKFRDSQGQLPATWQVIYGAGVLDA